MSFNNQAKQTKTQVHIVDQHTPTYPKIGRLLWRPPKSQKKSKSYIGKIGKNRAKFFQN